MSAIDYREDLELVEVEGDEEVGIAELYDELIEGYTPSPAAQKLLDAEDIQEYLSELAELVNDGDEKALYEALYSSYSVTVEMVSLGDIIQAGQFQHQFGVSDARISAILADPKLSLLRTNTMLEPITLIKDVRDSTYILKGGHHRLSAQLIMLNQGGADWQEVLKQVIPCVVFTVNLKKVFSFGGSNESQLEAALRLQAQWWISDNGSRKVTKPETDAYSFRKQGVDPNDPESIMESEVLKVSEKFQLLFRLELTERELVSISGEVKEPFLNISQDLEEWKFTPVSASKLAASFLSNLKKQTVEYTIHKKDGTKQDKRTARWGKDLERIDILADYIPLLIDPDKSGRSMIERALAKQVSEHQDNNVARFISTGGKFLAEEFNATFDPKINPVKQSSTKGNSKKAKSLVGRRFS